MAVAPGLPAEDEFAPCVAVDSVTRPGPTFNCDHMRHFIESRP
jgi:hypothetical protein